MKQIYKQDIDKFSGKKVLVANRITSFEVYGELLGNRVYIEKIINVSSQWAQWVYNAEFIAIVRSDTIFLMETENDYLELIARVI